MKRQLWTAVLKFCISLSLSSLFSPCLLTEATTAHFRLSAWDAAHSLTRLRPQKCQSPKQVFVLSNRTNAHAQEKPPRRVNFCFSLAELFATVSLSLESCIRYALSQLATNRMALFESFDAGGCVYIFCFQFFNSFAFACRFLWTFTENCIRWLYVACMSI